MDKFVENLHLIAYIEKENFKGVYTPHGAITFGRRYMIFQKNFENPHFKNKRKHYYYI